MGLVIPISIIWKLQNGLSVPEAVLTESIVLLATAIADLPAGFIANAVNNKRSLIIGAFFHLIGMYLLYVGGSFAVFVASALITGIAWAFVSGADEAYLHDDYLEDKDQYQRKFSTVTIIDESFTIVGMLLSSIAIASNMNMKLLFLFASILLFLHLVYSAIFLPKSKVRLPATHPAGMVRKFSLNILRSKEVASVIPLMLAFAVIYEAGRSLWQPHMQDIGIDVASFGVIFAMFKLASIGGSIMSRSRKFELKQLMVIFAIMLLSLFAFGLPFKVLSVVALCGYLFTENYFRVYMSTILNKAITTNRAAVLSFGSVIKNVSGALIVAGAGLLTSWSILVAILALITIKVPAILYTLRSFRGAV